MSETSDKNGYHFPYTAEEDHLTMMSRTQNAATGTDANYPRTSSGLMSSHQSSRTSSPPGLSAIQALAPLTSISDTSEYVSIEFKCE